MSIVTIDGRKNKMIFNGKIEKKYLKLMNESLNALVDECKIKVTNDGLIIQTVDPAHVSMISVEIPKESFEQFNVNLDNEEIPNIPMYHQLTQEYKHMIATLNHSLYGRFDEPKKPVKEENINFFGINLDQLKTVLKRGSDSDSMTLQYDSSTNKIKIGYPIDKKGTYGNVIFNCPDIGSMSLPKVPRMILPANATIEVDKIDSALKAIGEYSDHLSITVNDGLILRALSDKADFVVTWNREQLLNVTLEGPFKSLFPLDYMQNIFKGLKSCDMVEIQIGNDLPMVIKSDMGKMTVKFLLAPRIEND